MNIYNLPYLTTGRVNLIRQASKCAWYEAIAYNADFCTLPTWNAISVYMKIIKEAIHHG